MMSLVYPVALEMQDGLVEALLRHDCSHFQGQLLSPYSGPQAWLRVGITWGLLTDSCCPAPSPPILIRLVLGAAREAGVLNVPQVILNCSPIWEGLSSSSCLCNTVLVSQSHLRSAVFL